MPFKVYESYASIPADLWPLVDKYFELGELEDNRSKEHMLRLVPPWLILLAGVTLAGFGAPLAIIPLGVSSVWFATNPSKKRLEREIEPYRQARARISDEFRARDLVLLPDPAGNLSVYPKDFWKAQEVN